MDATREAFFTVCKEAEGANTQWVSLYADHRFYGGPEEGGWYGTDTELIASQQVYSASMADTIKKQVNTFAEKLTADAETHRNAVCAAEVEWLEARGLDDDFLPQPDGGTHYWVAWEQVQGSFVSTGDRSYS